VDDRAVLVVGVGNELRGDDGAGIEVARRLRDAAHGIGFDVREHQGEPTELLDVWGDRRAVVLVDTMRSGEPLGTVRRLDASSRPLPIPLGGSSSTHAFTLGDAIELGRTLHRLPRRVIVFGVEGRTFEAGARLSSELQEIIPALAVAVLREVSELRSSPQR
jgi:hydrogenase maturation protease